MRRAGLILVLLWAVAFSIGVTLDPAMEAWKSGHSSGSGLLATLFGDSRRLLANHFFEKADVYFHSGYYPSIFDQAQRKTTSHLEEEAKAGEGEVHDDDEKSDHLGKSRDWIETFGRNFFPSQHSHLEKNGEEREILPWLRLTAELDPEKVETYTVAAFWLRKRLGRSDEAEQFLREGLRANPNSYEILFELGKIYSEDRRELEHARNLYELALSKWQRRNAGLEKPDLFLCEQIVGQLAKMEEASGNLDKAMAYLERLKALSPVPQEIEKQIQELKSKK